MNYENPLIVQGDRSLLLDVHAPLAEKCRNALIPFAELEKSPEHLHTYRLTPLSLWNAASAGFSADDALTFCRNLPAMMFHSLLLCGLKKLQVVLEKSS